jgi:transcriptional regulator with XRE-family HTH domain
MSLVRTKPRNVPLIIGIHDCANHGLREYSGNATPAKPEAEVTVAGYQTVAQRNLTCAIRIRERRRQLGLTQAEVVNLVSSHGSHLSNQALSAIENGRRLAVGRLPDLADALDCTITYLLGLTADPHRWPPDTQANTHTDAQASQQPAEQSGKPPGQPGQPGQPGRPTAADAPQPPHQRRPAAHDPSRAHDPVHSSRRSWILGPDVPELPAEVRSQAHDASTTPRPR